MSRSRIYEHNVGVPMDDSMFHWLEKARGSINRADFLRSVLTDAMSRGLTLSLIASADLEQEMVT